MARGCNWSSYTVQVVLLRLLLVSAEPQYGDVRLVEALSTFNNRWAGFAEIYINDTWGTIHINTNDTTLSEKFAIGQVICRQLGNIDGYAVEDKGSVYPFGVTPIGDDVPVALHIDYCPLEKNWIDAGSHILRCNYSLPSSQNHTRDLIVACEPSSTTKQKFYDTQVRLHRGSNSETNSSGFAEVYLNGKWGPVCNLGQYEADTVCRQLGYTHAVGHEPRFILLHNPRLDNFTCSSSSSDCLRDCFNYPPPNYNASCFFYSYVNCSFDERKAETSTAGSFAKCSVPPITPAPPTHHSVSSHTLLIILAVAGVLVLLSVAMALLCCCCCVLERRRRKGYDPLLNHDQPHINDEDFVHLSYENARDTH